MHVNTDGTLQNPGAIVPRIVGTDVNGNGNRFTNFIGLWKTALISGSRTLLKLGYNIPRSLISRQNVVKKAIRLNIGVQKPAHVHQV